MARPLSNTVDHLPLYVQTGKSLFILENKFGDTGCACWYRLMRLLAATDGHAYDAGGEEGRLYLAAWLKQEWEMAEEFLEVLCDLGDIDRRLWKEKKVVWWQGVVNSLQAVYQNRKRPLPRKPQIQDTGTVIALGRTEKGNIANQDEVSTIKTMVSTVETPPIEENRIEYTPLPPSSMGVSFENSKKLNPRAAGTNPRARGTNPRAERERDPAKFKAAERQMTMENAGKMADKDCPRCRGSGQYEARLRGQVGVVRCECVKISE